MNKEIYSKVIDLLLSGELDYKKIAIELAKREPAIFLEILTPTRERMLPNKTSQTKRMLPNKTSQTIAAYIKSNQLISAIKELRNVKGLDLKTAKDIIYVAADRDDVFLGHEEIKLCEEIKTALRT